MTSILTKTQKIALASIFNRGAESATDSLSRWVGRPIQLEVSGVDEVDLADVSDLLGPPEELVAACLLGLSGRLSGMLVLVFEDHSGLALADILLAQPLGTSTFWGELEQSAAQETANIVACAYLKALAESLPPDGPEHPAALLPSPPSFRHEFAGSLLEFLIMDQAIHLERLLLVRSLFTSDLGALRWSLLFAPSGESLAVLSSTLTTHRDD